jgi:hypothetical protein
MLPPMSAPRSPSRFDRVFELRGGEIRVLQRNRRQADEPVRLRRTDIGEFFVLQLIAERYAAMTYLD